MLTYNPVTTTLLCVSTSGPATTVIWSQNQITLQDNGDSIIFSQTIVSTETGLYHNTLQLRRRDEVENLGSYRCHVTNSRGNDSTELTVVETRITHDDFRLGAPASINCFDSRASGNSGLNNVVEWLNATGEVVSMATNVSELVLHFEVADIAINNTVFSCRITDHVTRSVVIIVQGNCGADTVWEIPAFRGNILAGRQILPPPLSTPLPKGITS